MILLTTIDRYSPICPIKAFTSVQLMQDIWGGGSHKNLWQYRSARFSKNDPNHYPRNLVELAGIHWQPEAEASFQPPEVG